MLEERSYRLRLQALAGLAGFMLVVVAFTLFQLRAMAVAEENHRVLGELSLLEASLPVLTESAENYVSNAPRDYENYYRDVAIFLHDLRLDLGRVRGELTTLREAFDARVGVLLPTGSSSLETLAEAMGAASEVWQGFEDGLNEALGPDEAEPRLEWGAEFIAEALPGVDVALMDMSKQYRMFLAQQDQLTKRSVQASLAILLVLGIFGVVWFYRRVIRRIGMAADGCLRVANGDFGFTLPVTGKDEIADLSRAFNSLSGRSELVVRMLSSLQQAADADQSLAAVVNASGTYLPLAWAGLGLVDRKNGRVTIARALPAPTLSNWPDRSVDRSQPFGRELEDSLVARKPVIVNDLRERALADGEGEFLRALVRSTQLEALTVVPLVSQLGWEGLLFLGSRHARYEPYQTELLNRLGPTLALSFQRTAGNLRA